MILSEAKLDGLGSLSIGCRAALLNSKSAIFCAFPGEWRL
jgi:hypothetical protein